MVKQQKIKRKDKQKKGATVVHQQSPDKQPGPNVANAAVRTVHFVEVGDMTPGQLRAMVAELSRRHDTAQGGIHYVLPVRDGRIGPDIVFEEEWLDVVRKTCEVNSDGQIVLKGGSKDVKVVRDKV